MFLTEVLRSYVMARYAVKLYHLFREGAIFSGLRWVSGVREFTKS